MSTASIINAGKQTERLLKATWFGLISLMFFIGNPLYAEEQSSASNPVIYPDYSGVDAGQGIVWPDKVFSPYVDATLWPMYLIADESSESMVPYYNLGFIVSASSTVCKPTWGTYYDAAECPMTSQIKALRAAGGDVAVSFGGAANTPLHVTAPDAETLKEQYKRFIKAYGLTRIDFDIEGTWTNDETSLIRNSKALKLLQDELAEENYSLQVWFTLPVLPTGLVSSGENVIRLALDEGVEISGVNIMTMDYGDSAAPSPSGMMGEYGIMALESVHSQLASLYSEAGISKSSDEIWKMLGTTPMIGLNDITTEVFDHEDAAETLDFAIEKGIGMISMWSVNRDTYQAADSLSSVSNYSTGLAQADYGFSSIFNEYNSLDDFDPEAIDTNEWSAYTVYYEGDIVVYNGSVYQAKWWTQDFAPDTAVENSWDSPWEYIGDVDEIDNDTGDGSTGSDSGDSTVDTGGSTGTDTGDSTVDTGDGMDSGSGDTGGSTDDSSDSEAEIPTWNASTAYVAGDIVTLNNVTYKAKWWNRNFRPDTVVENTWDTPWETISSTTDSSGSSSSDESTNEIPTWKANTAYVAGTVVTLNNVTYKAKWWTKNFRPDTVVENTWDTPWETISSTTDSSGSSSSDESSNEIPTWNASTAYVAGTVVTLNNVTYKAKWWTKNFRPDTKVEHSWDTPWEAVN